MAGHTSVLNAFTVDLEDWFQGLTSTNPLVEQWPQMESRVVTATHKLLAILEAHHIQATFFVLGYVADRFPALIEKIYDDGHEIGIHGYYHRFVHRLSPDAFKHEVERSIQAVYAITGELPLGHRAPYFSINGRTPWALDVLQAQGLVYDSSYFPVRNMLYGYPEAPRFPHRLNGRKFVEFPLSTIRWGGINWPIAGGFYLRALPYALIRWSIARLNQAGQPAILYHHPWEIDTGQPMRAVTPRERLTHYYGRRSLPNKLHRLFQTFQFVPLRQLMGQVNGSHEAYHSDGRIMAGV